MTIVAKPEIAWQFATKMGLSHFTRKTSGLPFVQLKGFGKSKPYPFRLEIEALPTNQDEGEQCQSAGDIRILWRISAHMLDKGQLN